MIILFQNYDKWFKIHVDNNNIENNKSITLFLFKIEQLITEGDNKIKNIFIILIQWIYYLYLKLIKNLYLNSDKNSNELNIIRYLIKKTNYFIIKLYKSNIFNIAYIYDKLYFTLFLLKTNHEITFR